MKLSDVFPNMTAEEIGIGIEREEIGMEKIQSHIPELEKQMRKMITENIADKSDFQLSSLYMASQINRYPNFGFVYFLKNNKTGLTKIGRTRKLDKRMRDIQRTFEQHLSEDQDMQLELLLFTHTSLLSTLEADMHQYFAEYRQRDEWFDLSDTPYPQAYAFESPTTIVQEIPVIIADDLEFHLYERVNLREDIAIGELLKFYHLKPYEYKNYFTELALGGFIKNRALYIYKYVHDIENISLKYGLYSLKKNHFDKGEYINSIQNAVKTLSYQ